MRIFGRDVHFTGAGEWAARQRKRDERNRRAMTSQVGETGDAVGPARFPAPIAEDEIAFACSLLTAVQMESDRVSIDADTIRTALHRRMGAAAVVRAEPEFCPILAEEIDVLELAVRTLATSILTSQRDRAVEGQQLLDDLHKRQGHAEAVHFLGTVPVFGQAVPPHG